MGDCKRGTNRAALPSVSIPTCKELHFEKDVVRLRDAALSDNKWKIEPITDNNQQSQSSNCFVMAGCLPIGEGMALASGPVDQ